MLWKNNGGILKKATTWQKTTSFIAFSPLKTDATTVSLVNLLEFSMHCKINESIGMGTAISLFHENDLHNNRSLVHTIPQRRLRRNNRWIRGDAGPDRSAVDRRNCIGRRRSLWNVGRLCYRSRFGFERVNETKTETRCGLRPALRHTNFSDGEKASEPSSGAFACASVFALIAVHV